jgi:hypothetical protein
MLDFPDEGCSKVIRAGEVARGCGELREFKLRSVAEKTETLKGVHYSIRARP